MIKKVTVDSELADGVEREVYSRAPLWFYFPKTTDFYENRATPEQRAAIDKLNVTYGPVKVNQSFTSVIYQFGYGAPILFSSIRNNPDSYYRRNFKFLPRLIDHLQSSYIPQGYIVERILINMQLQHSQWSLNNIHPDLRSEDVEGGITILYYVNDSDGDTYFFNDTECIDRFSPIKGNALIYPANTYHAGSTPTATLNRSVLNMVFIPRPANI